MGSREKARYQVRKAGNGVRARRAAGYRPWRSRVREIG
jgi:hypothetical protein